MSQNSIDMYVCVPVEYAQKLDAEALTELLRLKLNVRLKRKQKRL